MKSPKAPTPPDPAKTAAAQTGMNIDTANTQQIVNQTNQSTPYGSLNYNQTGSTTYTDSQGHSHVIPQYTATQTLSPDEQKIFDTGVQQQQSEGKLALDQTNKLQGLLAQPVDLSNDAVEKHLFDLGSARLNPMFAQQKEQLDTQLSDQGIKPGSDAWNTAENQFSYGKNDAYNNLLLAGHGQSVSDLMAQRQEPINEITALMSGSQVSHPSYVSTPQSGVAGTDYGGMVQNQYAGQLAQYQAKLQQQQATMGGIFGLAGSAVKAVGGMPGANTALFG